jgi:hypothetical protein
VQVAAGNGFDHSDVFPALRSCEASKAVACVVSDTLVKKRTLKGVKQIKVKLVEMKNAP